MTKAKNGNPKNAMTAKMSVTSKPFTKLSLLLLVLNWIWGCAGFGVTQLPIGIGAGFKLFWYFHFLNVINGEVTRMTKKQENAGIQTVLIWLKKNPCLLTWKHNRNYEYLPNIDIFIESSQYFSTNPSLRWFSSKGSDSH